VKDLEAAQKAMEFGQKQIPNVKRWNIEAAHEGNEYHGRAAQLVQSIEREIPRLLAILAFTIDRLEAYAAVTTPSGAPDQSFFQKVTGELEAMLAVMPKVQAAAEAESPVEPTSET
jgi:hypothetical protein